MPSTDLLLHLDWPTASFALRQVQSQTTSEFPDCAKGWWVRLGLWVNGRHPTSSRALGRIAGTRCAEASGQSRIQRLYCA